MTVAFGIVVLLLFTVGLNVFMRAVDKPARQLPSDLGTWCPADGAAEAPTYDERRVLLVPGGWLTRSRLVEQRRTRRRRDGAILTVHPERTLERFRP